MASVESQYPTGEAHAAEGIHMSASTSDHELHKSTGGYLSVGREETREPVSVVIENLPKRRKSQKSADRIRRGMRKISNEMNRISKISSGSKPGDNFIQILYLLDSLIRELAGMMDSDIMPRWKRREGLVNAYLDNEPFPFGTPAAMGKDSKRKSQSRSPLGGPSLSSAAAGSMASRGPLPQLLTKV